MSLHRELSLCVSFTPRKPVGRVKDSGRSTVASLVRSWLKETTSSTERLCESRAWGACCLAFSSPIYLSLGRGMAGRKCCVKKHALELLQSRMRSRKQPNPITTSRMQHNAVSQNHYCIALLTYLGTLQILSFLMH